MGLSNLMRTLVRFLRRLLPGAKRADVQDSRPESVPRISVHANPVSTAALDTEENRYSSVETVSDDEELDDSSHRNDEATPDTLPVTSNEQDSGGKEAYADGSTSSSDEEGPSGNSNDASSRDDGKDIGGNELHITGTRMIFSCEEAERAKLKIGLQVDFTGSSDILTSEEANAHLADLEMQGILSRMNAILETTLTLSPSMDALLRFCLDNFTDFGQAYALLRPRWHMGPAKALKDIRTRMVEDQKRRAAALENDVVVEPFCPPRRLWDLKSNRVVPFWVTVVPFDSTHNQWFAVSHSWVSDELRLAVDSTINGREWPVPVPQNITLDCIRIELLNLMEQADTTLGFTMMLTYSVSVSYVWLDVLCLRQAGNPSKEDLRLEEWKLDVPTIGPIYQRTLFTVYYFNGLGLSFELSGLDSPRHWKNRAWTLQEITRYRVIAGRSPHSPSMPDLVLDNMRLNKLLEPLDDVFSRGDHIRHSIFRRTDPVHTFEVLDLMRHRSATNELDKIAGLVFFLRDFKPPLPAYIGGEDPESAWDRLIAAADVDVCAELFFSFPEGGKGEYAWYPSWQQIKGIDVPLTSFPSREGDGKHDIIYFSEISGTYKIDCYCLKDCFVEGLSEVETGDQEEDGDICRWGIVRALDSEGSEQRIKVTAKHSTPIPDGQYTLVSSDMDLYSTVVLRRDADSFEKVSTLRIPNAMCWNKLSKLETESTLQLL